MKNSNIRNAIGRRTCTLWKQAARVAPIVALEESLLKAFRTVTDEHVIVPALQEAHPVVTPSLTTEALASSSVPEIYSKFNVLNRRYHNVWDGMKDGGGEESSFVDIEEDVLAILHNIKEAHRALVGYHAADETLPDTEQQARAAFLLPDRVVFCIAFSQTRNRRGVAIPMLRMVKEVSESVGRHNRQTTTTNKVLRVVPILVGLSCPEEDVKLYASLAEDRNKDFSAPKDYIFYPKGGLYTFNACLQCLCTQIKNMFHICPSGLDNGVMAPALQFRCFILSEGWLHVRTIASLHHSVYVEAAAAAPEIKGNFHNFVEVVPGVVNDCLTGEEIAAFAHYIACRAVR